jgi:hypothetical protein
MVVEKDEAFMGCNYHHVKVRIDRYKELMERAASRYGTSSPQLLWLSQRLDRVLNEMDWKKSSGISVRGFV